jgi:cation/acetate symporter
VVLAMLAAYYVWPPVYGVLGRYWKAELLITGETDSVVLRLPARLVGGVMGELLTGLVAAGAFAAFLSTASGLLVSVAGALGYDLIRPARVGEVMRFRIAAIAAGIVAVVLGLSLRNFAINQLVGWAFAIAASSFCPLLVLGIWWRRLTAAGASAGMVVGGGLAVGAIGYNLFGRALSGWPGALLGQPAAWTVPIAFLTAVSVSLVTARRPSVSLTSAAVASSFALLHTPERLRRRPESAR